MWQVGIAVAGSLIQQSSDADPQVIMSRLCANFNFFWIIYLFIIRLIIKRYFLFSDSTDVIENDCTSNVPAISFAELITLSKFSASYVKKFDICYFIKICKSTK
jgi:hypothetical protein